MEKRKTIILVVIASLVSIAGTAFGGSDTDFLNVSATTIAACTISGPVALSFGNYDPSSGTPLDAQADLTFNCTKGTTAETLISTPRTMTDGADTLNYELYTATTRAPAEVWPNAAGGPTDLSGSVNTAIVRTIYGRIAINQDVGTGGYTGQATITVNY